MGGKEKIRDTGMAPVHVVEHFHEALGAVAGPGHVYHAQVVRLTLIVTAVCGQQCPGAELSQLSGQTAGAGADSHAGQDGQSPDGHVGQLGLGHDLGGMPGIDMPQFMPQGE